MLGSFLTRGLVMVFGYAYPAYECYKTVELKKPEIEQLRFWCQYWILVALLTVSERIGDAFVSWVPMYSEAKLAFFIYLWYPKTKGTTYVYESFFRPYVVKHETEIDRNLLELKTRVGDITVLYWQRASTYGQTRIFEILQYVAAQSTASPGPSQPPQSATNLHSSVGTKPQTQELPSPTTSSSSGQDQLEFSQRQDIPPEVSTLNSPVTQTSTQPASSSSMGNPNVKTVPDKKSNLGIRERLRKSHAVPSDSVPPIPIEHVSFYDRFWTKR